MREEVITMDFTKLWTAITQVATSVMTLISDLITKVVSLFWSGTDLTVLGYFVIIPIGVGVVFFVIRFVLSLINRIKIGRRG